MIFGEWRRWLNNRSRNTPGRASGRKRARSARPGIEVLEGREVPAAGFFQGFEIGADGWNPNAGRVASGTHGVTSRTGNFHGEIAQGGAFTWFGPSAATGYTATFPQGGYTTSVDIYLDPAALAAAAAANDTRFDYTVAIGTPTLGHRRDFAFNAGYYNDAGEGPRFVISASNNTGRANSFPKNPGRDPFAITTSGWYTFQHRFFDSGNGVLAVELSIKDTSGATQHTWTLSNATDVIGSTVGGNRYGWFATQELPFLAIENSFQSNPSALYVDDDWASLAVGTDPDGSGPANLIGFDAFSSIQNAINAASGGETINVAAGTYLESVTVNKPVTVLGAQAGLNPGDRTNPALESIVSAPSGTNGFSISADNVTVRGFTVTTAGGGVYGVAETTPVTGTNIDRNIVSGFGGVGIALAAGSSGAAVTENDVSNNYAGIYLSTGASNVTVRANVVHDNTGTGPDAGSGIVLEGNNTGVLVSQNFIRDNAGSGIYVWGAYGNDFSGTNFTSNSITGNDGAGFNNTNATLIDASGNWWGTSTAAGVTAETSGNIDFMPFLVTGDDSDLLTAGFQGNASVAPGQGNVRVKVVGKRLMITGDNLDNLITVEKESATSYRVTGLHGTHINGLSSSDGFVFENVTRGIDADLKRGDDMLVLDGSTSPFTVNGNIKVRTGRGDDLVQVLGVSVSGKGDFGSWSGNDLVQLSDSDFSGLAVYMGNGASTSLELDGVNVSGRTAVRGGNGADSVRAVDSHLGAVLIQTGLGKDTVHLEEVHATGRVQVETGRHTDMVAVTNSTFDAAVVFGAGLGNDDELDAGTPLAGGPNSNGNTFAVDPVIRGFES